MRLKTLWGKGEIARDEQFLLFPHCFLRKKIIVSPFVHNSYLYLLLNLKSLKLAYGVKGKERLYNVCLCRWFNIYLAFVIISKENTNISDLDAVAN